MKRLEAAILAAHASDDRRALARLYARAADKLNDLDAACFFSHPRLCLRAGDGGARGENAARTVEGAWPRSVTPDFSGAAGAQTVQDSASDVEYREIYASLRNSQAPPR